MKNQFGKLTAAALVAAVLSGSTALAVGITGTIHLTADSSATLVNDVGPAGPATTANADAITFGAGSPNADVTVANGSFAGADTGTLSNFRFTGPGANQPPLTLWTTNNGFSFDLLSISSVFQNSSFINLTGNGLFKKAGLDDTAGNWTFTVTSSDQASFTFTSAQTAAVPDSGSSLILLGVAMSALGIFHRMKSASK